MIVDVQLYSKEELPRQLCFSGDPYENECSELVDYSIVFYRDSQHARAVYLERIVPQSFLFYSHTRLVSRKVNGVPNYLTTADWTELEKVRNYPSLEDYKKKHGDTILWFVWNQKIRIISMTDAFVERAL